MEVKSCYFCLHEIPEDDRYNGVQGFYEPVDPKKEVAEEDIILLNCCDDCYEDFDIDDLKTIKLDQKKTFVIDSTFRID